jgi:hypothetical protein
MRTRKDVDFDGYARRIAEITRKVSSEAGLQGELDHVLRELLGPFGIDYRPLVNTSLARAGLSQSSTDRPDSLFGHIVLDYKAPGTLSADPSGAKGQVAGYLNEVTGGGPETASEEARRWAGILWDGATLAFCQAVGNEWSWTPAFPTSAHSLQTLVSYYRSLKRRPLSSEYLTLAFGKNSDVARALIPALCDRLQEPSDRTTMLFREWRRLFQQVSTYALHQVPGLLAWARDIGVKTDDASILLFAIHTYYSIVVKLLSAELLIVAHGLSPTTLSDAVANAPTDKALFEALAGLESGEFFKRYRISNFLEGGFFSWYIGEGGGAVAAGLRAMAREFLEFEPGTVLIRPAGIRDLLKEFYTSLLDDQIRHDLGEYYTPDWLAQYLLDRSGYTGQIDATLLDPTCGSGTILVEAIVRLRKGCEAAGLSKLESLRHILGGIKGIDLNPLAVISARANYILAIADLIFALGEDIEIPVYLADCINVPPARKGSDGLLFLAYDLDTEVGTFPLEIPEVLARSGVMEDVLLALEESMRRDSKAGDFLDRLALNPRTASFMNDSVKDRLRSLQANIVALEDRDWDKIWCRILQNALTPSALGKFDYIVGNPPWVRWSRLPESYRERVKEFCGHYGLVSGKGYSGGIESDISTVVTYSCADNWLKIGGTLGFLITFSVFQSASARGFRMGELPDGSGLLVREVHDFTRVQPFPDPSNQTGIYIAQRVSHKKEARFAQVPCFVWKTRPARVPPNTPLKDVLASADIREAIASPVAGWGSPWFMGSRETRRAGSALGGESCYLPLAHRGTVTDASRIYWLKVEGYSPELKRAKVRTLTAKEMGRATMYEPVSGTWIESDLLYPLLRGRDCGRFCAMPCGWYLLAPNSHYENMPSETEFAARFPLAYTYLNKYREDLKNRSSYKRYQSHLPFYAIFCVGEYAFSPFKVVWMEQQDPSKFRASVVSSIPENGPLGRQVIVPDHKLFYLALDEESEAHYVCAVLNSEIVRDWLGGFLNGKQIGTSVFEHVAIPRFDPKNTAHQELAEISRRAHRVREGTRVSGFLPESEESQLNACANRLFQ